MLYLPAIVAQEPEFLDQITALDSAGRCRHGAGRQVPAFDAKAYLTARAEAKRLEEKLKAKKPFGVG